MKKNRKVGFFIGTALTLTVVLALLSLLVGKYPLTVRGLLEGEGLSRRVFLTLRLPRTCMALLGGFGLGIAGSVYQTVFRNPLASPDIIGVASGASAGAAFGILMFASGTAQGAVFGAVSGIAFGSAAVTLFSFLGGLLAVVLTLALARLGRSGGSADIVLSGIAVHALAQTLLMVLKLTADPERELASIEYWMMGSLGGISLYRMPAAVLVCLLSMAGIFLLQRQIFLLSLEDEEGRMLGVPVERMRLWVLLLATLLTAGIISLTGLISFVGLLAPHSARLLVRESRLSTLILGGLMGSILLTAADILARSLASAELPVSIFTSLLGAPFLLYLLFGKNRKL